jgi:hypothetical protein
MPDSDDFPVDRITLGPLANTLYGLGSLEHGRLSATSALQVSFFLEQAADSLDMWGFTATCGAFRDLAKLIEENYVEGHSPLHGREAIPTYITMARQSLMHELEAHVFLPVDPANSRFYLEPLRDWEEVAARFSRAVNDIEEAGKCYALGRYAACVYHTMQVLEHGLLSLGDVIGVTDPKSGFTAVDSALQRIVSKGYQERTDFEREHFAFFEQVNASVHAMKNAWRNRISHAQGVATLLTPDFTPQIAMEIYVATRGFMRRLATDMPPKKEDRRAL